jgi:hypothetical protein
VNSGAQGQICGLRKVVNSTATHRRGVCVCVCVCMRAWVNLNASTDKLRHVTFETKMVCQEYVRLKNYSQHSSSVFQPHHDQFRDVGLLKAVVKNDQHSFFLANRAGPRHVGAPDRPLICRPRQANSLAPLRIDILWNFSALNRASDASLRARSQIADNFRRTSFACHKCEFTSSIFLIIPETY